MMLNFTLVIDPVPSGYIGYIKEVPGANTQGDSIEEVMVNLQEALSLVIAANLELSEQMHTEEESIDDNRDLA